jgi:hypothetical protein
MPRAISDIARELNENMNAGGYTSALIPANVKAAMALAGELAEAAAAVEARVDQLEETFADYVAAHETAPAV